MSVAGFVSHMMVKVRIFLFVSHLIIEYYYFLPSSNGGQSMNFIKNSHFFWFKYATGLVDSKHRTVIRYLHHNIYEMTIIVD